MKIRQPTDFLILDVLEETGRNVAPNLVSPTGKSRENINTRLPVLEDYGLVRRVGPANHSGLYEITPRGKTALIHQDQYDTVNDFDTLLDESSHEIGIQNNSSHTIFARGDVEDSTDGVLQK